MAELGSYIIPIDGRWSLDDLYKFPRAFEQVYFALESVIPADDEATEERIAQTFRTYPWRGGYSAVSFYNQLKYQTPPRRRPTIQRIRYSSPGLIDLNLIVALAGQVGTIVTGVAGLILVCNKTYNQIYTDMQKRKLLGLEGDRKTFELTRDEITFVLDANERLARMMDISDLSNIHRRTDNPIISLKILMSIYRRIRLLAEYKNSGKADLRSLDRLINDGDL